MAVPSQREIEDVIVELLAEDAGVDPVEMRDQLAELGASMPVDSLLAVEVLARVEVRFGVQLPTNHATADAMTSVAEFAAAIRAAAIAAEGADA